MSSEGDIDAANLLRRVEPVEAAYEAADESRMESNEIEINANN